MASFAPKMAPAARRFIGEPSLRSRSRAPEVNQGASAGDALSPIGGRLFGDRHLIFRFEVKLVGRFIIRLKVDRIDPAVAGVFSSLFDDLAWIV
jgi:hypothetical protein